MALLEAKNLAQSYNGQEIIHNVSIELNEKEIVCLIGRSGVGKTTLFQILSGLHKPTNGQVFLDGEVITGQAGKISYMLQKDMLLPYRTIEDNIALPLIIQGAHKKEVRSKIQHYFDEPFSALDSITKLEMHKWYLKIMKKIELSTIFVSHDIDEAIYLSNRVYVMAENPGTVVKEIPIIRTIKNRDEFSVSPEFLGYKKQLLSFLQ